jgi:CRP/FNR family transcriptional regulator, cyclic AMP receptor protein
MGIKLDVFHHESEGRTYAPGEKIFEEHEMGFEMYVVIKGEVELSINGEVLETLGEGEPFGEMALIDQAPRPPSPRPSASCFPSPRSASSSWSSRRRISRCRS